MKQQAWKAYGRRAWTVLPALMVMVGLAACSGYQTTNPGASDDGYGTYRMAPPQDEEKPVEGLEAAERWGVEVLAVRSTADGYMLDFRYRVTDAGKAAPLLDRRNKAHLLVEKSNARLEVPVSPKIGALRQTSRHVKEGRNYFMLFANPSRHVKPGDRVRVVIGDFTSDALTVM